MDPEIDHVLTPDIVCPHCGHEQEDTDYCADQNYEGEEECIKCGGRYSYCAEFTVDWTTKKL